MIQLLLSLIGVIAIDLSSMSTELFMNTDVKAKCKILSLIYIAYTTEICLSGGIVCLFLHNVYMLCDV